MKEPGFSESFPVPFEAEKGAGARGSLWAWGLPFSRCRGFVLPLLAIPVRSYSISVVFVLLFQAPGRGQQMDPLRADSLFRENQFTESFQVYKGLAQSGRGSPAMLLRMAFIQEGLGNYVEVLHYLHTYYRITHNKAALKKMSEVARVWNLQGYEFSDRTYFINVLKRYRPHIAYVLMGLSLLVFLWTLTEHRRGKKLYDQILLQAVVITLLILAVFPVLEVEQGIVGRENTLMMDGPSGGANLLDVIESGHKVEVLSRREAWVEIVWEGRSGFIRKFSLIDL